MFSRFAPGGARVVAAVGVCTYLAGVAVPYSGNIPLIILVACSAVAIAFTKPARAAGDRLLSGAVLVFVAATALSIWLSDDPETSAGLIEWLLPGGLLFFLVSRYISDVSQIRWLYLTFSAVSLGLSLLLLWSVWLDGWVSPNVWAFNTGSPLLMVGNDVTLFAVVAPFSFVLVYRAPTSRLGLVALTSLVMALGIICLFRSRGALLTFFASLTCVAFLIRPRLAIRIGILLVAAALAIDAILGFPLVFKFVDVSDARGAPRLHIWQRAWNEFRLAPWLGHGPLTTMYTAADERTAMRWSHNLYLDAMVWGGALGLAALMFMLVGGLYRAWQTHRHATDNVRLLNAAAFAALAAFCLGGIWEISLIRVWAVLVLFTLLGVIGHLAGWAALDTRTPEIVNKWRRR
jgi:O-antigen ligase